MKSEIVSSCSIMLLCSSALFAQNAQRQATMVGGGGDRGKCTLEVIVDGVAQVEVRGNTATLRTLSGQPAQWRRFECNGVMPPNPANFRFSGVDGRGRQTLTRDPRNGGVAVIEIEDRDGGAEGYTFDLVWDGAGSGRSYQSEGNPVPRDRDDRDYRPNYRDSDYYRRYNQGFGVQEAIRVCQDSAAAQASRRFRSRDIRFYRTVIDDGPGRQDWVTGTFDINRNRRDERYRFACSVDFNTGRVRTVDIDARPLP